MCRSPGHLWDIAPLTMTLQQPNLTVSSLFCASKTDFTVVHIGFALVCEQKHDNSVQSLWVWRNVRCAELHLVQVLCPRQWCTSCQSCLPMTYQFEPYYKIRFKLNYNLLPNKVMFLLEYLNSIFSLILYFAPNVSDSSWIIVRIKKMCGFAHPVLVLSINSDHPSQKSGICYCL